MIGCVIVPLTRGRVAVIDAVDAKEVLAFRWCYDNGYAARKRHVSEAPGPEKVLMHRQILGLDCGDRWALVDHRDGNGLNNRRSNIRQASASQNSHNRQRVEGYVGVSWCPRMRRWRARISVNGRHKSLGSYASQEEAARAYDKVAFEVRGEFARLNFPEGAEVA